MQGPRLSVQADATVIVKTPRDVDGVLDLDQQTAAEDGVHGAGRHVDRGGRRVGTTGVERNASHALQQRGAIPDVVDRAVEERDLTPRGERDPRLFLDGRVAALRGGTLVGVQLHAEVLARVEHLDQQRVGRAPDLTQRAPRMRAGQHTRAVLGQVRNVPRLAHGPCGHAATSELVGQAPSAPRLLEVGRLQQERCIEHERISHGGLA